MLYSSRTFAQELLLLSSSSSLLLLLLWVVPFPFVNFCDLRFDFRPPLNQPLVVLAHVAISVFTGHTFHPMCQVFLKTMQFSVVYIQVGVRLEDAQTCSDTHIEPHSGEAHSLHKHVVVGFSCVGETARLVFIHIVCVRRQDTGSHLVSKHIPIE